MKTIHIFLLQCCLVATLCANPIEVGYSYKKPQHLHVVQFWEAFHNYCIQLFPAEIAKDFGQFHKRDSEIRRFFAANATFYEGDFRLENTNKGMISAIWSIAFLEYPDSDLEITIDGENVVIHGHRLVPNSTQSSGFGRYTYGSATFYSLKLSLRLFRVTNSGENQVYHDLRIVECRYDFTSNVPYKQKNRW